MKARTLLLALFMAPVLMGCQKTVLDEAPASQSAACQVPAGSVRLWMGFEDIPYGLYYDSPFVTYHPNTEYMWIAPNSSVVASWCTDLPNILNINDGIALTPENILPPTVIETYGCTAEILTCSSISPSPKEGYDGFRVYGTMRISNVTTEFWDQSQGFAQAYVYLRTNGHVGLRPRFIIE